MAGRSTAPHGSVEKHELRFNGGQEWEGHRGGRRMWEAHLGTKLAKDAIYYVVVHLCTPKRVRLYQIVQRNVQSARCIQMTWMCTLSTLQEVGTGF